MKGKSLKLNFGDERHSHNVVHHFSAHHLPLCFQYSVAGWNRQGFVCHLVNTYFNMFAQLGIPIYGIRICAMVRDDREQLTRTAHELLAINPCSRGVIICCAGTGHYFCAAAAGGQSTVYRGQLYDSAFCHWYGVAL